MERVNWREEALCAGMWAMFDDDREDYESPGDLKAYLLGITGRSLKGAPSMQRKVQAECIAICNRCPVKQECLDDAIKHHDDHTIRGGMTAWQRSKFMVDNGIELPAGSRYRLSRLIGDSDGDV